MSTIFIIDDRATNRSIFARLAQSVAPDGQVRVFADPMKALVEAEIAVPDLIITDYKMPQLNGASFVRRLRDAPNGRDVPIIVITVYEDRNFRVQALEAGATDFLQSPVDHHEFVTRVRNLLQLGLQQRLIKLRALDLEQALESRERTYQAQLRENRHALAQVIDTVPAMILAASRDGSCVFANAALGALIGADHQAVVGRSLREVLGPERGAQSRSLDHQVFESGRAATSYEEAVKGPDGTRIHLLTTKSPLRDATGQVSSVLTTSLDITSLKLAERRLHHMAHHDDLTDLPNRSLMHDRIRREIARARRGDYAFALHLLDLDRFKGVNDALGHHVGDHLLRETARRLTGVVRETDTVARLGGDEFAILQTGVEDERQAEELARRVVAALAAPVHHEGTPIGITVSVGIALHPQDGATGEELLRNADVAMYRAKALGKNGYSLFVPDLATTARSNAALDGELRAALALGRFELFFQPQLCLRTGRIIRAEALLRLNRGGGEMLEPREFLPLAEENGLIVPINEWVLREACRQAATWASAGLPELGVACNVSPVQFRRANMQHLVSGALEASGLDPSRLELELTEGILLETEDAVMEALRALRRLGVRLSIDDFGTGYSTLSYVRNFPVDLVKIDQSFIRSVETSVNDLAIVRAIITLCHSLGIKVLAEGVEAEGQVTLLEAEGCDEVQGFWVSRPLPANEFVAFVQRWCAK